MKEKIAITTTTFAEYDPAPIELLKNKDYDVVSNVTRKKLEGEDLLKLTSGCVGIIAGTEKYDRTILEKLSGVRVISRCGTGLESIDINAALDAGIKIVNTPDAPTQAVAELTIGLMLALLRKVPSMDRAMRSGSWRKDMGNLLNGKKVGIIGMGRIGQKVAELLSVFRAEVAYFDVKGKLSVRDCVFMEKDRLLAWSDIITLHCSFALDRQKVVGGEELRLMKKGAWLINVARGELVDENELAVFLKDGKLSGAAIDVFENEPYKGQLLSLDNVILTPHIGSYAKESRIVMETEAVKNLLTNL